MRGHCRSKQWMSTWILVFLLGCHFVQQLNIKEKGKFTNARYCFSAKKQQIRVNKNFSAQRCAKTAWLAADSKPWVTTGFADVTHLVRAIGRHEKSKSHITSRLKLKLFGKVRID